MPSAPSAPERRTGAAQILCFVLGLIAILPIVVGVGMDAAAIAGSGDFGSSFGFGVFIVVIASWWFAVPAAIAAIVLGARARGGRHPRLRAWGLGLAIAAAIVYALEGVLLVIARLG